MSPTNEDNGRSGSAGDGVGVLSNLPRSRPQRSSPRRAAARKASAESAAANGNATVTTAAAAAPAGKPPAKRKASTAKRAPGAAAKPRARRTARTRGPSPEPAPIQGFECDGDRASGPVQPPGGSELASSAVEILGELTKAGFATGERLLKDVLARLPLT